MGPEKELGPMPEEGLTFSATAVRENLYWGTLRAESWEKE